ncbi:TPA: hypothetical protein JEL63_001035 [Salmonella enterica subsp. enterica serovar Enteritidis]|uniref:hypothetical protein n=1 Tax=Salmonella enterica TaxID=28901 RepID=UPI0004F1A803|nr:hypothetical protein [Salmonella enterica]HAE4697610.1 hypothetical protein [Salmonella enterica subsp. enterica serovar Enteritidis]HAU6871690.1 hypothetical protein [Salmonella enterica subsp. enterica serovar Enteritidis]
MDTQLTVNKFIFSLYVILRISTILHSHPFTSIHVRLNLFHQFRVITGNSGYICFIPFHIVPFRAVRCVYLI